MLLPQIEITYANVKNGIFQPCESEHTVLLHFNLKHDIIINKKKHKDVQFFTVRFCVPGTVCACVRSD